MSIEISFPIRYVECDAQRVAYYANYLAWFELGQEALLASLGRSLGENRPRVLEAVCRYRAPLRYGETVTVRNAPLSRQDGHLWITHTVAVGQESRAEGATLLAGCGDLLPATAPPDDLPPHLRLPPDEALTPRGRVETFPLRVRYAETDPCRGAHFARYLDWFEVGRIAYLHGLGLHYPEMEAQGHPFVIAYAGCRYFAPVRFDDLVGIQVWLAEVRQRAFALDFRIAHQDGRLVALGRTVQAFIDPAGRPVPIPAWARALLLAAWKETEREKEEEPR